jgi:hypothetical protein
MVMVMVIAILLMMAHRMAQFMMMDRRSKRGISVLSLDLTVSLPEMAFQHRSINDSIQASDQQCNEGRQRWQQKGRRNCLSDDVRQLADSGCSGQHWS